jgi:hypothetical protein
VFNTWTVQVIENADEFFDAVSLSSDATGDDGQLVDLESFSVPPHMSLLLSSDGVHTGGSLLGRACNIM